MTSRLLATIATALLSISAATQAADSASDANPAKIEQSVSAAKDFIDAPFAVDLSINTMKPVSYGDEIIVSVRLMPHRGFDLLNVKITPKGPLAHMYLKSANGASSVECPLGQKHIKDTASFVITCRLPGSTIQPGQWFGSDAFLETKRLNLEVEIITVKDSEFDESRFFFSSVDFASPKSHVVMGGFLGAILWALFLGLSPQTRPAGPTSVSDDRATPPLDPENAAPNAEASSTIATLQTWPDLWRQFVVALPRWFIASLRWLVGVSRQALLGGMTALVLIVLAKGTEGFAPPVSVRIQDFWGGLMVGLLCAPLAKWLRDKISATI